MLRPKTKRKRPCCFYPDEPLDGTMHPPQGSTVSWQVGAFGTLSNNENGSYSGVGPLSLKNASDCNHPSAEKFKLGVNLSILTGLCLEKWFRSQVLRLV